MISSLAVCGSTSGSPQLPLSWVCPGSAIYPGAILTQGPVSRGSNDTGMQNLLLSFEITQQLPKPIKTWKLMWRFCKCVYLELGKQGGH